MFDKKHSIINYREKVELEYKKLTLVSNSWNLNKKKYENVYKKAVVDLDLEETKFKNKEEKYSIVNSDDFIILKYNETCMNIYNKFYNYIKHFTNQKYVDIFIDKVNAEDVLIKHQLEQEKLMTAQIEQHHKNKENANILGGIIMSGGCVFTRI